MTGHAVTFCSEYNNTTEQYVVKEKGNKLVFACYFLRYNTLAQGINTTSSWGMRFTGLKNRFEFLIERGNIPGKVNYSTSLTWFDEVW